MNSNSKDLLEAVRRIKGLPALVIGDVMLDKYIWGKVTRISQEAPVPVVEVSRNEERLGGAALAARNLLGLGAKVTLCGYCGDDSDGLLLRRLAEQDGMNCQALFTDQRYPTIVKTRVIAHHQQVVRIDREEKQPHDGEVATKMLAALKQLIPQHKAIVLSDYGKGTVTPELIAVLNEAAEAGKTSLSTCPLMVDPHPANYGIYGRFNIAKPNRREAEEALGVKIKDEVSAIEAARELLRLWKADIIIISLGEDGLVMAFADGRSPIILETMARQVFDVSGAGDTLTATFTAALASGSSPSMAGELANIASGIVVSEVGTAAITIQKLEHELNFNSPITR